MRPLPSSLCNILRLPPAICLFVSFSLLSAVPKAYAVCASIPGAAALWSNPDMRVLWIGETHGTVETPAVFGDLVCDALAHHRSVTVALELFTNSQPALNTMMDAPDLPAAEKNLLSGLNWQQAFDGRSSQAMLALLVRLRELKAQYPALRVAAVDGPSYTGEPGTRDEAIGKSVLALADKPAGLVLALTGNVHAMKKPFSTFKTSAMFLPPDAVASYLVISQGGEAWQDNQNGCGAQEAGTRDSKARALGFYADPHYAQYGYDGVLALGGPVTASPPANAAAAETSDCRKEFLSQKANPGK